MNDGIIDSSVLIDCLRGKSAAVNFLAPLTARKVAKTHLIVAAELLAGARDLKEQGLIDSFLAPMQVIAPNQTDGLEALTLYRKYHLSHGVDWPDRQIAASALRLGIEVFTQNIKHFAAFSGLRAVRAY